MGTTNPMIGSRHMCQCCGRVAVIVDSFDGDPRHDEPPGYDYIFEGEPGVRWISNSAARIRFKKVEDAS